MTDVDMLMTYLDFVAERHNVYLRRASGARPPWTSDQILSRAKFTNVFRWLDKESQFLIRELFGERDIDGPEVLFRALMFRFTNRSEPWLAFRGALGRYPDREDLLDGTLMRFWCEDYPGPAFSNAYRIFAHARRPAGVSQLEWIVNAVRDFIADNDLVNAYLRPGPGAEKVKILSTIPRVGDFMGMQVLTDVGYSGAIPWYDEDEWVVPGPGAIAGAKAIGLDPNRAIEDSFRFHHGPGRIELGGRTLSRMDIQNTFCEFGKYARYLSGNGSPRGYTPGPDTNADFTLPYRKSVA